MTSSPEKQEVTLAVAIRRYFDVALFLLIFTGFGTLASTGRLDFPTVLIVTGALLFRGYNLARRRQVLLSERWTNLLTIGCVAFYIADEFMITGTFLGAIVHLILFVMLVRLFSAQKDRDHYLLAALSFVMVLAAAVLTVDSTFLVALGGFVLVAVGAFILMEMIHASERSPVQARDPNVRHAYRRLSVVIAGIAPVLLLLIFAAGSMIFFVLPRVSAGYLSTYTGGNNLSSGFSGRVELGRIGQIQQSKSVVMHVQVEGDAAGSFSLKMRGITLNKFDGRSWENTHEDKAVLKRSVDGRFNLQKSEGTIASGPIVHYHVNMEPFLSDVFFLMASPRMLQGSYRSVSEDAAGNVFNNDPDHSVSRYEAESMMRKPGNVLKREADPSKFSSDVVRDYLQLPAVMDPRIKSLAEDVSARSSTPYEKASAIEEHLRDHYGYTLELPSTTPADPVSHFLFVRKKGHCEYFASAMAVMLRSIGIPSRIVNGFSGGEFNDLTSQYVIRASEAHSWVEAYIPGEGWMEFDPTPAGTPEAQTRWSRLMLYLDAMSSFWREWVINYDLGHQLRLSQDASRGSRQLAASAQAWGKAQYDKLMEWARRSEDRVGKSTVKWGVRALMIFIIGLFLASLPRMIAAMQRMSVARKPRKAPQMAASIWYERMVQQMARRGFHKTPSQTPEEFAAAIGDPELKSRVIDFTGHYEHARFGGSVEEASQLPELYEELKKSG